MEYTIQECKEDMIKVWSQLAKSGQYFKPTWTELFANNCPCCEYSLREGIVVCLRCPVPEWAAQTNSHAAPCENDGEDYAMWCKANSKLEAQYWANRILIKAYMIRSK